jgi:fructokinase
MKNGVVTLGEALIDMVPLDETNTDYRKSPGGAPANVAVGVARLGGKASFIGKVGDDVLGRFLEKTLQEYGVRTDGMRFTDEARTGLVFVTLSEGGERSFDFFVRPSADFFLRPDEVDEALIASHRIFHFGSISLIRNPSLAATRQALDYARRHGLLVSFDPNIRLSLWKREGRDLWAEIMMDVMHRVDLVKISEEECEYLTSTRDPFQGADLLLKRYPLSMVLVTLGEKGSMAFTREGHVHVEAIKVQAVDTTGAGDAFVAGMLACLSRFEGDLSSVPLETLKEFMRFASICGGLAVSARGAMSALPTREQVEKWLNAR